MHNKLEEPPYYIYLTTYVRCVGPSLPRSWLSLADTQPTRSRPPPRSSYMILIFIGHIRDYFGKRFFPADFKDLMAHNVRRASWERPSWNRQADHLPYLSCRLPGLRRAQLGL